MLDRHGFLRTENLAETYGEIMYVFRHHRDRLFTRSRCTASPSNVHESFAGGL
jgi:hypothetical protein